MKSKQSKKLFWRKSFILAAFLLVIFFAAFFLRNNTQVLNKQLINDDCKSIAGVNWKKYTHPIYKYSIEYPETYNIQLGYFTYDKETNKITSRWAEDSVLIINDSHTLLPKHTIMQINSFPLSGYYSSSEDHADADFNPKYIHNFTREKVKVNNYESVLIKQLPDKSKRNTNSTGYINYIDQDNVLYQIYRFDRFKNCFEISTQILQTLRLP